MHACIVQVHVHIYMYIYIVKRTPSGVCVQVHVHMCMYIYSPEKPSGAVPQVQFIILKTLSPARFVLTQ